MRSKSYIWLTHRSRISKKLTPVSGPSSCPPTGVFMSYDHCALATDHYFLEVTLFSSQMQAMMMMVTAKIPSIPSTT